MKKIFFLGLILFSTTVFSQATRFVYQVTMTPDSTNAESKKTELAYLDTDGKKSMFYSENRLKRDSIMERMRATRSFDRSQMENLRSNLDFTIEKDLSSLSLIYKTRIARDQYQYEETPSFGWKILPETVKIGEYETQKAEANYGGRVWYAWFTQQIPFLDGPYKFSGLPGLIVKIQDSKGDYSFDLMQTKNIASMQEPQSRGQAINVAKNKFKETENKFLKDPVSFFNAQRGGSNFGSGGRGPGGGGPQIDPRQMQEMQKRMEAEIKSKNNPIELK